MAYRVFISYSRKDFSEKQIRNIVDNLENPEFKVTTFADILSVKPGSPVKKNIISAIDECDTFVLFWSKNSRASDNVPIELGAAIKNKDIIPMKLEENLELPPLIADLNPIPAYNNFGKALDKLKKHIFGKAANRNKMDMIILLFVIMAILLWLFLMRNEEKKS